MEKVFAAKHCEGDCRTCTEKIFCSENKDFSFITRTTPEAAAKPSAGESPAEKPDGKPLPWSSDR